MSARRSRVSAATDLAVLALILVACLYFGAHVVAYEIRGATRGPAVSTPAPVSAPVTVAPTEDSPGWDCERQGNHLCGPVAYSIGTDGMATVTDERSTFATISADRIASVADGYSSADEFLRSVPTCTVAPTGALTLIVLGNGRAAITGADGGCILVVASVA